MSLSQIDVTTPTVLTRLFLQFVDIFCILPPQVFLDFSNFRSIFFIDLHNRNEKTTTDLTECNDKLYLGISIFTKIYVSSLQTKILFGLACR